jgi:3-hydroxyisobutyrate dehydrogenase
MPTQYNHNQSARTEHTADGSSKPTVTVVGAGIMGSAMVSRLHDQGFDVRAWSRHPDANTTLSDLGVRVDADVTEAVAKSRVVITMLPTAEATRSVMVDGAALQSMQPNAIWVQMGTIGKADTEQLEIEAQERRRDVIFVDAPVSGSRVPAETGQLLILASGPPAAADTLRSVFDALGRSTLWLGTAGAGSQMKLVLNTWLAFQTEGAAESAALARRFGLRTEDLASALEGNPLASPYALTKLERMVDGNYETDFSLGWALKDLDLVTAEAPDSAPVAGAIAQRWRELVETGWRDADVSAARNGLGSDAEIEGGFR